MVFQMGRQTDLKSSILFPVSIINCIFAAVKRTRTAQYIDSYVITYGTLLQRNIISLTTNHISTHSLIGITMTCDTMDLVVYIDISITSSLTLLT